MPRSPETGVEVQRLRLRFSLKLNLNLNFVKVFELILLNGRSEF